MNRVLVVDDHAQVRDFLRRVLELAGYWVRVAEDGVEAVRLARKLRPDLVVTDIVMPGGEGYEAITELADRYPGLPILAISGYAKHGLDAARALGATHCLAKPFTAEELLSAVRVTAELAYAVDAPGVLSDPLHR